MYWLFGPRLPWLFDNVWMLIVWLAVLGVIWYFFGKKQPVQEISVEQEADEEFDLELWHGALQYLRNHHDELEQWVFMNELYKLFIDALWGKYNEDELLETATKEQIDAMHFLKESERELLGTLYTPVFQSWDRDAKKRNKLIDSVEHLVIWRDDLASHDW